MSKFFTICCIVICCLLLLPFQMLLFSADTCGPCQKALKVTPKITCDFGVGGRECCETGTYYTTLLGNGCENKNPEEECKEDKTVTVDKMEYRITDNDCEENNTCYYETRDTLIDLNASDQCSSEPESSYGDSACE